MMGGGLPASTPVVPLACLPDGAVARLVTVQGGTHLRSRLMAMGLRAGVEVRVVHNGGRGPFVIASGDARIVLGRGMAHKVMVVAAAAKAAPGQGGADRA